jgi:hypothetical protein
VTIHAGKGRVTVDDREANKSRAMQANLAAIGRHVELRSRTKDNSPAIREVEELVEGVLKTKSIKEADKASAIARTLEERFGRAVSSANVKAALAYAHPRRITEVVIAAGILKANGDPKLSAGYWRKPDQTVRSAIGLKRRRVER